MLSDLAIALQFLYELAGILEASKPEWRSSVRLAVARRSSRGWEWECRRGARRRGWRSERERRCCISARARALVQSLAIAHRVECWQRHVPRVERLSDARASPRAEPRIRLCTLSSRHILCLQPVRVPLVTRILFN